jgi:hypothetical protein
MFKAFLTLILGLTPLSGRLRPVEYVDMIELNHFHDKKGNHVYSQVIFYERLAENGQFRVRSWALIEMRESLNRLPQYDPKVDKVVVDMKMPNGIAVRLESRLLKETWTQHDPERRDKDKLPEQYRLRLAVEGIKKL